MNAPKEKPRALASETGRKTGKREYHNRHIRQDWRCQTASVTRERLAKLKRCGRLDGLERHVIAVMLRRTRFRILDKDLVNRLYAAHFEGLR